ncbi:unnamed protein product, partial [Polarella glacialis]
LEELFPEYFAHAGFLSSSSPRIRITNAAIHRPCRPSPACSALVDGSSNSTGRTTKATQRSRGVPSSPNGTQLEAGDAESTVEAFASSAANSRAASPFFVFLEPGTFVSQIIIFCSPVGGTDGTGGLRRLVVMTWETPSDQAEGGKPETWIWDHLEPPTTELQERSEPAHAQMRGGSSEHHGHSIKSFRIIVRVQRRRIGVVSVHWDGATDTSRGAAALQITEVAALVVPALATEDSQETELPLFTDSAATKAPAGLADMFFAEPLQDLDAEASKSPMHDHEAHKPQDKHVHELRPKQYHQWLKQWQKQQNRSEHQKRRLEPKLVPPSSTAGSRSHSRAFVPLLGTSPPSTTTSTFQEFPTFTPSVVPHFRNASNSSAGMPRMASGSEGAEGEEEETLLKFAAAAVASAVDGRPGDQERATGGQRWESQAEAGGAALASRDRFFHQPERDRLPDMQASRLPLVTTLAPDPRPKETKETWTRPLLTDYSVRKSGRFGDLRGHLRSFTGISASTSASSALMAASVYVAGVPLFAWLGLLAAAAMCLPRLCRHKQCAACDGSMGSICSTLGFNFSFFGPHRSRGFAYSYDRLPEAEAEAPLAPGGGVHSQPDTTSAWWHDASSSGVSGNAVAPAADASRPARLFNIGSPESSRASSPVPLLRSRSCETEPEGELDPCGYDQLVPCPASNVLAVPPVVIGRPEDRPAAAPASASRGRVMLLYASPLCYRDVRGMMPLPQIPFELEWDVLVQAYDEAAACLREEGFAPPPASARSSSSALARIGRRGGREAALPAPPPPPRPGAVLSAQPLTAGSLQRALAPARELGPASVLHLSAHGVQDCLVMEDGRGTAHFFSCEMLRDVLQLRGSGSAQGASASTGAGGLRLVILNACSLRAAGLQLAQGGIPHVICSSADLRDSASHVFLCALYGALFQGSTVARAFNAGLVALRSHAEQSSQLAARHYCLLPEGEPHDEVLFPPEWQQPAPAAPSPPQLRLGMASVGWGSADCRSAFAAPLPTSASGCGGGGGGGDSPRSSSSSSCGAESWELALPRSSPETSGAEGVRSLECSSSDSEGALIGTDERRALSARERLVLFRSRAASVGGMPASAPSEAQLGRLPEGPPKAQSAPLGPPPAPADLEEVYRPRQPYLMHGRALRDACAKSRPTSLMMPFEDPALTGQVQACKVLQLGSPLILSRCSAVQPEAHGKSIARDFLGDDLLGLGDEDAAALLFGEVSATPAAADSQTSRRGDDAAEFLFGDAFSSPVPAVSRTGGPDVFSVIACIVAGSATHDV